MSKPTVPSAVTTKWPRVHAAIHGAVSSGDLSELRAIVNDSGIADTADTHGSRDATVLHTAANTTVEIVDLLLIHGAETYLESRCAAGEDGRWSGHTPLQIAAKSGHRDIAHRMIDAGAVYDILSAAALGDRSRVVQLVEQDPSNLGAKDDYRATVLHWAASQDQQELAEYLLAHDIEIDSSDDFGETPLLVASVRRYMRSSVIDRGRRFGIPVQLKSSIVDLLLDRGATVDVFAASALGQTERIQGLLSGQPSLANYSNCHGTTPLHCAARNAQVGAAQLLLDGGADINAQDNVGCPPLFYAAYCGNNAAMTHFLCSKGADLDFRNIWGKEIRDYDCGWGCYSIIMRH